MSEHDPKPTDAAEAVDHPRVEIQVSPQGGFRAHAEPGRRMEFIDGAWREVIAFDPEETRRRLLAQGSDVEFELHEAELAEEPDQEGPPPGTGHGDEEADWG